MNPAISPDGHWIAYSSDESGRPEIYARPLPIVGDSWLQISRDGGSKPLWSRDGREVFFVSPQRELMAATLALDAGIGVTRIDRLFDATPYTDAEAGTGARPFDVSLDGKRFLMARREGAANPLSTPRIVVVLGWDDELRRLLP
jgi:dipeptidyl aminopeptidase/acylaminoacyl peptidase